MCQPPRPQASAARSADVGCGTLRRDSRDADRRRAEYCLAWCFRAIVFSERGAKFTRNSPINDLDFNGMMGVVRENDPHELQWGKGCPTLKPHSPRTVIATALQSAVSILDLGLVVLLRWTWFRGCPPLLGLWQWARSENLERVTIEFCFRSETIKVQLPRGKRQAALRPPLVVWRVGMRPWMNRNRLSIIAAVAMISPGALAETVNVNVFSFDFSAAPVGQPIVDPTINVGDTIRWVWVNGLHDTTSVAGVSSAWASDIMSAPFNFEHTFTTPGTYQYYCSLHGFDLGNGTAGGMSGIITVVPEPASLGLLILGASALLAQRRRSR